MLFPSFGQAISQELAPVKQLMSALKSTDKKTLTSIESQLLLRELYDTNFQISAHNHPHRPMSLVGLQPKETYGPYSRQYRLYRRFAALKINDLFGISIHEFLQQPREMVELMFTVAEDKSAVDDKNNTEISKKLEAAVNGGDTRP